MSLEVKVLARTEEINQGDVDDSKLYTLGGKMAGICYMPEDYFDSKIQNTDRAISRANMTASSGHHSVFDHGSMTLQISGLPKIMAMLLNSTEQYTTSEKSARYTVMKPDTETEVEVYEKWKNIFENRIGEEYPDLDEKTRKKMALENARYMISVFTPTHMAWTVTYRQIAYVIGWLETLENRCSQLNGEFNKKLAYWCNEIANQFRSITTAPEYIKDNKGREFEFFHYQQYQRHIKDVEQLGSVYQVTYLASFAELAQLQRHRTIHYEMDFTGDSATEYGVFVPPIIRGTPYEDEWKQDFERVAYCYPQGTLVNVLEQGRAEKFFEKCKERLCGRAQLETMMGTKELMQKFIDAPHDNFSYKTFTEMHKVAPNEKVVTKCCMQGVECKETCFWKAAHGLDRKI